MSMAYHSMLQHQNPPSTSHTKPSDVIIEERKPEEVTHIGSQFKSLQTASTL